MFKCILFDCDGVLVSAEWKALFNVYKAIVRECTTLKWEDLFKDVEEFKIWWSSDIEKNRVRLGLKDMKSAWKISYEIYRPSANKLQWVDDFLSIARERYLLGIVTNGQRQILPDLLGDIFSLFSVVIGSEDIKNLKPNPEAVDLALEKLKIKQTEKSQVLLIGDTPADILAGKAAGIKTAAVVWEWGLGKESDFEKEETKPDFFFRTPECFRKALLE
ncbi:MAG: HAD family hydrolase [Candidatus Pacebacteria bacterium]|nr:HAD family hydrolase [Candidatus Paceibacterota bacterium]